MGAKGVRASVASALAPAVAATGLRVVDYADDVKPEPLHPVAVIYVDAVGPTDLMTTSQLLYRVKLIIAVAKVEPGAADDDLDDLLDDVRACLDDTDQLLWTVAQRGAYLEAFPCYTFDLELRS